MSVLSLDDVLQGLLASPSYYPQKIDLVREAILFLRLDRNAYRAASFLDDRILTPRSEGRWLHFTQLEQILGPAAPSHPLHFIFHAGHVGSTLLSRFLEEAGALALREPLPLRALAQAHDELGARHALIGPARFDQLLRWMIILWSRNFDAAPVIVKATSSASRLCPTLLDATTHARALYINLAAEPYLATLLAGENSHIDLRGQAAERVQRLERLAGPSPTPLHAMSLGEIAALTWAVERLTQLRAQAGAGERLLALDFETFLNDPGQILRRACAHLGLEAPQSLAAGAAHHPLLQRYSKAPEHAYTPALRSVILAQSRARNAEEIRKGMAWLEQYARSAPHAAALMSA